MKKSSYRYGSGYIAYLVKGELECLRWEDLEDSLRFGTALEGDIDRMLEDNGYFDGGFICPEPVFSEDWEEFQDILEREEVLNNGHLKIVRHDTMVAFSAIL